MMMMVMVVCWVETMTSNAFHHKQIKTNFHSKCKWIFLLHLFICSCHFKCYSCRSPFFMLFFSIFNIAFSSFHSLIPPFTWNWKIFGLFFKERSENVMKFYYFLILIVNNWTISMKGDNTMMKKIENKIIVQWLVYTMITSLNEINFLHRVFFWRTKISFF